MAYPTYPSTTFSSLARPSNPSLNLVIPPSRFAQQMLRGGDQSNGPATPGLSLEEQQAAFAQAHPFAPTGSFTPTLPRYYDPASGPGVNANPSRPIYDQSIPNAVDGVGRSVAPPPAATASLVQGQPIYDPRRYDLRGRGAPAPVLSAPGGPSPEAMAYQALFPSAGAPPAMGGTPGVDPNMLSMAGSAASLQDSQAADAAQRTLKLLGRAGALPSANDSPEASANKYGYLNSRLATSLNGGTPRAPGSPVAPGGTRGAITTGDAAAAYRMSQVTSRQPRLLNFAPDVRGLVDAQGNVHQIPQDEHAPKDITVGGRKMTKVGDKFFDDKGAPIEFGRETPPRAPDILMKTLDPDLYQAQREEYLNYTQSRKAQGSAAGQPSATTTNPADAQAIAWANANPKDPRAAKIKQKLGVK